MVGLATGFCLPGSVVVLDDLDMAIPSGWRVVPGTKTHESGQSFVNQVRRQGDESIYALKRLKNVHRRERRERFAREVAAMDRLRGAGLALPPVVEQGLERKDPYFVMPWYERGSLQSLVDERVFVARPLDGIDLLVRIAIELQKLHEAEVAHRDLKPANVLLADSSPLLTDFGLCLLVDDEAERLTTTAEPIGSRFYIAPENESGINEDVDQRPADFYAFGKMTWVVLAGRNPFARELTGRPELRIRNVREDERFASLDYLLDELLDTDPRSRLSDWHDVIGELASHRDVLRGDAPRSRPPSVDQTLRVARRVRQVPAFQAAARRRLEDQRVDQWMHDQLLGPLTRIAAEIRDELAALTDASRGAVEFQMSGGGPDLATLVGLEPRFAFPGYDPSRNPLYGGTGSPILFTIQPDLELRVPQLWLGLYVARAGQDFWILRVPIKPNAPGYLPDSLIDRYLTRLGPLPIGRQTSVDRAADLCRETTHLFRDMAHRYLLALSEGTDPFDAEVWSVKL
jgi:serine/threonine protein kinase